jgi:hypothetical protein
MARLFYSWSSAVNKRIRNRVVARENVKDAVLFWVKAAKLSNWVSTRQARLTIKTNRSYALKSWKHWSHQAAVGRKLRMRRTLTRRVTFIKFFGEWKWKTQWGKSADLHFARKWFNLWSESTSLKKMYAIVCRGEKFRRATTTFEVLTISERRAVGIYSNKLLRTAFNQWICKFVQGQQLNMCRLLTKTFMMKNRKSRAFIA